LGVLQETQAEGIPDMGAVYRHQAAREELHAARMARTVARRALEASRMSYSRRYLW
jgi:hypothetical protein